MCLAMLDDTVTRLSLTLRPIQQNANAQTNVYTNGVDATISPNDSPHGSVCGDKPCSLTPLAGMESGRCGMGLAVVEEQMIVVGKLLKY